MNFFIQHGYGKGTKISDVFDQGSLGGVILSPGDEEPTALRSTVSAINDLGIVPLLDPQTYVYSITPPGVARCHSSHGVNFRQVKWSQSAREVESQIESIRAANVAVGIDGPMIAPTCVQSTFTDIWTPLSLQYARSALDSWGSENTIASVAIDEGALTNWHDIADWLDIVTGIDVRGFYIVVNRSNKGYPPVPWDSLRLGNLLRLMYNLSVLNEYEVHWGYSDLEGVAAIAAGVGSVSSGWHYTLRQFFTSKWQPSPSGGQPPTPRVYVPALWASLKAEEELSYITRLPYRDEILQAHILSRFASGNFSSWGRPEGQVQFMTELSNRVSDAARSIDISTRLDELDIDLQNAADLYGRIKRDRIVLPPSYAGRVSTLRYSLEELRTKEGI
ncbi:MULTISPECIES: hypothetical protein [Rhodococcus]|uniref:hypothetical protein n=1 Tax=Rhodococcus TaxID=1827 RepID=UPI001E47D72D|nr:hypothetical protein [Rhodococcus pyridinivorans]MCD2119615.1 hypothetical protein [Rhodococcus pyridinivorans]MCZ4628487.1 hypothetical protein [Rhodococcus pyridinivorans]MCZ4649765.1 hypothetical protein [Rhodococcus pyridinivorans]MDJ0484609.1 hypothetical protein [Rhodococcus pyridinivorans]MDV7255803.1 hypothetical protein [Rhodococcus pyridinivorans]